MIDGATGANTIEVKWKPPGWKEGDEKKEGEEDDEDEDDDEESEDEEEDDEDEEEWKEDEHTLTTTTSGETSTGSMQLKVWLAAGFAAGDTIIIKGSDGTSEIKTVASIDIVQPEAKEEAAGQDDEAKGEGQTEAWTF